MRRRPVSLKPRVGKIDRQLLFVVLALVVFGVVMVFNASVLEATRVFGDKFFFARRQLIWAGLGFLGLLFTSFINYRFFERIALPFFLFTVLLLAFVLTPWLGSSALGATRWIEIGPVVVQPAELAKLSLIIFLASLLSKRRSLYYFLPVVAVVVALVLLQPDLGTATILVALSLVAYFVSGASILHFLILMPVGVAVALLLILTSGYRKDRLMTFLYPKIDPLGISYHVRQILIALGSGGIFGLGLGQSRQKYFFLPKPTTDSIFAVIGEELGFLGTTLVMFAFIFLILRGFFIAKRVADPFGKILASGITAMIGVQAFVNIAAMVALVPLTGIPLPFLSYGGSSLLTSMVAVGILLNISKHTGEPVRATRRRVQ